MSSWLFSILIKHLQRVSDHLSSKQCLGSEMQSAAGNTSGNGRKRELLNCPQPIIV